MKAELQTCETFVFALAKGSRSKCQLRYFFNYRKSFYNKFLYRFSVYPEKMTCFGFFPLDNEMKDIRSLKHVTHRQYYEYCVFQGRPDLRSSLLRSLFHCTFYYKLSQRQRATL